MLGDLKNKDIIMLIMQLCIHSYNSQGLQDNAFWQTSFIGLIVSSKPVFSCNANNFILKNLDVSFQWSYRSDFLFFNHLKSC